ncbi:CPBP family glutamic-type intramembrane protease [Xanthomonas theicola]|uniref:CPBP family glutamic-type intramembrane protease n=1 Tax=Xanthomonas theicola TaxID=56464 RepID=UPI001FE9A532|nr:CPBP family intramembrane glutamic endopeptidase [Xanthomonas theicola]
MFRGFLPHQLSTLIRRFRAASAVAAPLGAVAFGLMHAGQGLSGIVPTGIVGSLFGDAYLRSGRTSARWCWRTG